MWKRNGLSIVLALLFLCFISLQVVFGWQAFNDERLQQGQAALSLLAYLHSGHFVSATFENWESEFLQMGMYVLLTVKLRQAGSAESRPLDSREEAQPHIEPGRTPWPVRKGGLWLKLYEHSLAIAFGLLFLVSFVLHLCGSWRAEVEERLGRGEPPVTLWHHLTGAEFWFESFQNWQSEFLAVLCLVLFTIWLRQKDSPQSKPVEAPHTQTGD
ncbi:hypothetical protein P6166_02220 [Stenotrophomonas sp. HITSZ_GD]|uniref:DUF6766 family protein n=1 Tax=Stenotrophomonas sp. HITSZ_GD TaxID=3037248 RepID=UPI00240E5C91|nr:DUF6766 family protein [Stenotrophomonas sp. HITSZ_GD]MDG2524173.1 hypothetical protein [Stenotrophomonas sp. HITSZ_GD]